MEQGIEMKSYDELLKRLLAALPEEIDRREGSLIMTAAAPVCAELAAAYLTLESYYDLLFPDSSVGSYLDRLAAQYGLTRGEATAARLQVRFFSQEETPFTPPVGMRFTLNGLFYLLTESEEGAGVLLCETTGETGNSLGAPLPCDYLSGFGRAEAVGLLTPGEEREEDAEFRKRLCELLRFPAFGGNVSDYKEKVHTVQGVGGVRVTPVALGGGTVLIEVLGSDLMPAGEGLLEEVRGLLIPEHQGDGLGLAPIGHTVTVASPVIDPVEIEAVILTDGDPETVKAAAEAAVKEHLRSLRAGWEDLAPVVRWSSMIAAISEADGVVDVSGLTLNGGTDNIRCEGVPVEAAIRLTIETI